MAKDPPSESLIASDVIKLVLLEIFFYLRKWFHKLSFYNDTVSGGLACVVFVKHFFIMESEVIKHGWL